MKKGRIYHHPESPCLGCPLEEENGSCKRASFSDAESVAACAKWKEWFSTHWRITTENILEALNEH